MNQHKNPIVPFINPAKFSNEFRNLITQSQITLLEKLLKQWPKKQLNDEGVELSDADVDYDDYETPKGIGFNQSTAITKALLEAELKRIKEE